jgi:hypothetical protein
MRIYDRNIKFCHQLAPINLYKKLSFPQLLFLIGFEVKATSVFVSSAAINSKPVIANPSGNPINLDLEKSNYFFVIQGDAQAAITYQCDS